jgi:hypothetical protein
MYVFPPLVSTRAKQPPCEHGDIGSLRARTIVANLSVLLFKSVFFNELRFHKSPKVNNN